jgi:sarcosine oxidase, subunit beta
MAETADAIIIGAGIMGSATAYHLMRRRYGRVVVLERDGICSGSTALASGGVRHQYANRVGIELTQQSIVVYENFEAEFGVDPQFRQHGYLILQQTEDERDVYARSAAVQRAMGVDTRVLRPDEVRALCPYLRTEDLISATYSPRDGFADPYLVTTAIAARARDLGASIKQQHPVPASSVWARGRWRSRRPTAPSRRRW